jgi:hypothetical protein
VGVRVNRAVYMHLGRSPLSRMFFAYPVPAPQEAAQRQAKKLASLESLHRVRPLVGEGWLWGR